MKKILLSIAAVCCLLSSCKETLTETVEANRQIDESIRNQVNDLDIKLFEYLKAGDYNGAKSMMSFGLLKELSGKLNAEWWQEAARNLEGSYYNIGDEVHVVTMKPGEMIPVTGNVNDEEYVYNMHTQSNETMLSFMKLGNNREEFLLAAQYGKTLGAWRLEQLRIGLYTIMGKPAPYYYALAEKAYADSNFLRAINMIGLCDACSKPCDTLLRYSRKMKIKSLTHDIQAALGRHMQLPIVLDELITKPVIIGLSLAPMGKGWYQAVSYKTSVDLDDTARLRIENKKIREVVGSHIHGLKDSSDYIIYKAFNEIPTETSKTHYRMMVETVNYSLKVKE